MLFPYKYVQHDMDKLQNLVDYIFFEIWCKAYRLGSFSLDHFNGNELLKTLMESFYYNHTAGGDRFYRYVEIIYNDFLELSPIEIKQFQSWYSVNNDINEICENISIQPIRYSELKTDYPQLTESLATFFKGLFSKDFLSLAIVRQEIGEIGEHYNAFVEVNDFGRCPFCGISPILGQYSKYREAYDHYLPKGYYPFNSINFHNLVPACHHCNSTYKNIKDPSYITKDPVGNESRRKSFYPYSSKKYSIEIAIELQTMDIENLNPDDIDVSYGPAKLSEEINTWRDVYGIDERYRNVCSSNSEGKAWFQQIKDEWKWKLEGDEVARSPEEILNIIKRHSEIRPYVDSNFLKMAFLEACDDKGLFD